MQLGISKTASIYFIGIYFDKPIHNKGRFCSKFAQAETFDLAVGLVIDWASKEGMPNIRNIKGKKAWCQDTNKFPFPEEVLN